MLKQKTLLLFVFIILTLGVIILLPTVALGVGVSGIQIPTNVGLPSGTIVGVLSRILNWLLMVFVVIATISFVVTGLQFIFSFGGASGSEAQAKKNFTYTIIAIFIVGGSLIILKTILTLLGSSSTGTTNIDYWDPYGAPDNWGNDGTANPNGDVFGTNASAPNDIVSPGTTGNPSSTPSGPFVSNPSQPADPNTGGIWVQSTREPIDPTINPQPSINRNLTPGNYNGTDVPTSYDN